MANTRFTWLTSLAAAAGMMLALNASAATSTEPGKSAKSTKTAKAEKSAKQQPVAATPAALGDTELALAGSVYVGKIPCELGQTVTVEADQAAPGYFHLYTKTERFHVHPVESSTGALRLEDISKGAVWLQLANKSMLMSQKQGRRLADECMSPVQQAAADHLKANPAPNLLDVAQSPRATR